jgi:hypothetical protein
MKDSKNHHARGFGDEKKQHMGTAATEPFECHDEQPGNEEGADTPSISPRQSPR